MLHPINWPNFIVWLSLLLKILGNICKPDCDVIKFEINLIFLTKPFYYMTQKSRQKLKYLEKEKSFPQIEKRNVIFSWKLHLGMWPEIFLDNYPFMGLENLELSENLTTNFSER